MTKLEACALAAVRHIPQCNPEQLGKLAWSSAVLKCNVPQANDAIAEAALARMSDIPPQAVADIAWAFAEMRSQNLELMASISSSAIPRKPEFESHSLATLAWAVAHCELRDGSLQAFAGQGKGGAKGGKGGSRSRRAGTVAAQMYRHLWKLQEHVNEMSSKNLVYALARGMFRCLCRPCY